jgi:hypothetical protein
MLLPKNRQKERKKERKEASMLDLNGYSFLERSRDLLDWTRRSHLWGFPSIQGGNKRSLGVGWSGTAYIIAKVLPTTE